MTPSVGFRRIGAAKDPCASAYSHGYARFLPVTLLLDRRLVVVTGKGGVGRTTVAGALALAAVRAGKRVIVAEVTKQEHLSRPFRREAVGYSETELAENFYAISIDPEHALEEYLGKQVPGLLSCALLHNRIFEYFVAAAPGVRELTTIGKAWELSQQQRKYGSGKAYDLVILDAPASGHGLAMLQAPRTFAEIARVGPIRRRADGIHDFVRDPERTGVVSVALPQEMPVNETIEFREKLGTDMGMDVDAIVLNQLLPERFTSEEYEQIESVDGGHGSEDVAAALRAA